MNRMRRHFFNISLMTLSLCLFGCGGGEVDQVELGVVTGKVTMDGKPLANAVVVFKPANGNPSSGTTDSEGNYELMYLGKSKGAIVGSHTVTIVSAQANGSTIESDDADIAAMEDIGTPDAEGKIIASTLPPAKKEPIPAKYNTKSELKEEVAAGENTINFELTSD